MKYITAIYYEQGVDSLVVYMPNGAEDMESAAAESKRLRQEYEEQHADIQGGIRSARERTFELGVPHYYTR